MNILKIFPFIKIEICNKELSFITKTNLLTKALFLLKNHFKYQFKMLTCISGVDYPKSFYRFQIAYELLSIKYNSRVRFKVLVNELTPVQTIERIFVGATWWECEIWDMFGVFFSGQYNLTRILTDYGFQGYPLRKDFPLTGFMENRFNGTKTKVGYEKTELAQEYRTFKHFSVHENFIIN